MKKNFFLHFSLKNKSLSSCALANGSYGTVLSIYKDFNLVKVVLPSMKKYLLSGNALATLGRNSNLKFRYNTLGSYKLSKRDGCKPHVRGVAMNPVDHPHGGRTKTNKPEVSP